MKAKKPKARKGQFWTIDNKLFRGHHGRISKVKKNKTVEAVCVTSSKKSFSRSNIKLNKNPDPKSKKDSFVMKRPMEAKFHHLGTHRPEMKVTDKRDKAIFRNVAKRKPRKLA